MSKKKITFIGLSLTFVILVAVGVVLVIAGPGDYEPDTGFEVDGNIAFNGGGGQYDWWNGATNHPSYPPAILIADPHSKNVDDDYFSPAGKFDEPEKWIISYGSVGPGQNELTNIFVWALAPGDVGNTDSWLVMGMERVKKSGTFALDFELNQQAWTDLSRGPIRTQNDIAVGFELKGNPTDAQTDLQVLIVQFDPPDINKCDLTNWSGQGGNPGTIGVGFDPCPAYGESGWYYRFLDNAAILESSGLGVAIMNAEDEGFSQSPFTPNGETYTSYDPQGNIDDFVGEFEFAEAAINLTALGLEPGCPGFGSVHAKSRASLEVKADLKDLSGPRPLPVECYIEGYKYLDINGNGDWDEGEPGLNGWTIDMDNGSTTTTADDGEGDPGYYRFENLADGTYVVSEDCSSAPSPESPADTTAPWVQTEPGLVTGDSCGDETHAFVINIDNKTGLGDFGNGAPAIEVTKTCSSSVVELGETIDYDIEVENTGNVYLYNGTIYDYINGTDLIDTNLSTMAPGDTLPFTPWYTPTSTGVWTNTVQVTGNYGDATVFASKSDQDSCATTVVDAKIAIAPDDTNEVGDDHTFVVTVMEDIGDGNGFQPAAGESVTVTLTDANGAAAVESNNTCASTDGSGQCSVTFTSATAGTVTGHAASDVQVAGLSLHRETDGTGNNSSDAVKTFVDAKISIAPDDTNEVGDDHTFVVTVMEDIGDSNGFQPAAGESVTVTLTDANGAAAVESNNTCASTDGSGQCSVTFTSATAGTVTGHAASDVQVAGLSLHRETDGTGNNSGDAVKTFVDAKIVIAPDDTNEVGDDHTFVVTVMEDIGNGSGFQPAENEVVSVTLTDSNGAAASVSANTCASTNASGQCSVTFTSATAGKVTGHAASDVQVAGLSLHRETDGTGDNSGNAVKTFVDAKIAIVPDDTNEVGDDHTFVVTVMQDNGNGSGFQPAENEVVSITLTDSNGAAAVESANTCASTNASGQCSVTFTSASAGKVTGHAASDVQVAGLSLHRETDGTGDNSGDAVKTFVDARISIAPDGTNGIGENHTFTVTVQKNEGAGAGWVASDDNTIVTVTLTNSGSASYSISSNTCAGPGTSSGTCLVTFTSATAGTVTGHAAANIASGGLSLFRETDGLAGNSGDATKIFVDGSLTWLKHNSQGALLGGATFQVCRTHDRFGADIADECVTVLDNTAPDLDPDAGEFKLDGLYLGRYTIEETKPPAGYAGDPFVETIELTLASPDKSATHIWVNVPNQGCTPGWWKNQGLGAYDEPSDALALAVTQAVADKWYGGIIPAGFDGTHDALFRVAFNLTPAQMRGLPADLTLLQAVELGGGGFNALARHGTSALLNSLSVAYEYSADQVLQDVHDAFISGDLGTLIDDYNTASNRDHSFCPTG